MNNFKYLDRFIREELTARLNNFKRLILRLTSAINFRLLLDLSSCNTNLFLVCDSHQY